MRFRPLAEYHSFLLSELKEMVKNNGGLFPSPYRVSFILIGNNIRIINSHIFKEKFPSPYGVSFILIKKGSESMIKYKVIGFRLLTEYHSFLCKDSLIISKILSFACFRLLTEYHSFL